MGLISFWQLHEASTLLELALRKAKIDEADDGADRALCRVNSGSVFVMKGVLQYFEYRMVGNAVQAEDDKDR